MKLTLDILRVANVEQKNNALSYFNGRFLRSLVGGHNFVNFFRGPLKKKFGKL